MKKYHSEIKNRVVIYFSGILLMTIIGYTETQNLASTFKGFLLLALLMFLVIMDESVFTYLQLDERNRQILYSSSFFSTKLKSIDSIVRISKQPHPIFKGLSWSLAIYHHTDSDKEKKLEIMPAFSEQTMGQFLTDLKTLNSSIQFDQASQEWMEKAQKAKV